MAAWKLLGLLGAGCTSRPGGAIFVPATPSSGRTASSSLQPPSAAICFAGGFRSFLRNVDLHKARVVDPWPSADVFMFLDMRDTFTHVDDAALRTSRRSHDAELDAVRRKLGPPRTRRVAVRTYTQDEARSHQQGIQCHSEPEIAHQMWSIRECFGMAFEHESRRNATYTWFVRARPDAPPALPIPFADAIQRYSAPEDKIAWRRYKGTTSDMLAVMTRAAAIPLWRLHESFFIDVRSGRCGLGTVDPQGSEGGWDKVNRLCSPAFEGHVPFPRQSAECLMYLSWVSDNVTVVFDDRFRGNLVRPWAKLIWPGA